MEIECDLCMEALNSKRGNLVSICNKSITEMDGWRRVLAGMLSLVCTACDYDPICAYKKIITTLMTMPT